MIFSHENLSASCHRCCLQFFSTIQLHVDYFHSRVLAIKQMKGHTPYKREWFQNRCAAWTVFSRTTGSDKLELAWKLPYLLMFVQVVTFEAGSSHNRRSEFDFEIFFKKTHHTIHVYPFKGRRFWRMFS